MRKKMASPNLLERGLGKDVNLAIITALLSLVVSFATSITTSMIISRAESRDEIEKDKQNTEREALKNLQRSVLEITDAAVDVANQKLPARFPTFQGLESPTNKYLRARREFEAAWDAVENTEVKIASTRVLEITDAVVHARSSLEAERYDSSLALSRREAIGLINDALRDL
jgi:hypothetical protein